MHAVDARRLMTCMVKRCQRLEVVFIEVQMGCLWLEALKRYMVPDLSAVDEVTHSGKLQAKPLKALPEDCSNLSFADCLHDNKVTFNHSASCIHIIVLRTDSRVCCDRLGTSV